jgi:dCMP deaminase
MKRILLIDIPVIHRGFIDFLSKNKKEISKIGIFSPEIIENHSEFKRDIASLSFKESKKVLSEFGFINIFEVFEEDLEDHKEESFFLVDDEVSRSISKKYFLKSNVLWSKVFLRWDKTKVLSDNSTEHQVSTDDFDKKMMSRAYNISGHSSDWWRQIGAVLVKNKKILIESYNQGLPSDYTPYQSGAIRDFINPGERPDLANYIHGEQKVICEAAKNGVKIEGTSLYVTHFPCAVCSKLIAASGIKYVFFAEGSSNADGEVVLNSAGVIIKKINGNL